MNSTKCPICASEVADFHEYPAGRAGNQYDCPNCGRFLITGSTLACLERLDLKARAVPSHQIWQFEVDPR